MGQHTSVKMKQDIAKEKLWTVHDRYTPEDINEYQRPALRDCRGKWNCRLFTAFHFKKQQLMGNPHTRAASGVSSALPLGRTFVFLGRLLCSRQKIRECGSFFSAPHRWPTEMWSLGECKIGISKRWNAAHRQTGQIQQSLSKNTDPLPQTLLWGVLTLELFSVPKETLIKHLLITRPAVPTSKLPSRSIISDISNRVWLQVNLIISDGSV